MFNTQTVMQKIQEEIQKKNISIAKQYFATSYYERLIQECRGKKDIVIFGAGSYGQLLCCMLQKEGIDTVRCFCDNNNEKWGTKIKNLGIYSLEKIKGKYPDAHFLVTIKGYEMEIIRQLVSSNVSINNISIFAMEYTGLVVK